MADLIHMNVSGCDVTIDLSYVVKTQAEKDRIIQNISRIYADHELKKLNNEIAK